MVRPLRHLVENGWYHVFGRGWERRRVFLDDVDRTHFLKLLGGLSERYGFIVHAYALMDNHHHLIIQTPRANLSAGMQWFNTSYSAWFNSRHNRVGALWQGRYRDVLVENSAWAYELSVYVHLNPLRIERLGLGKNGRMMEGRGYSKPTEEQARQRLQELRAYRWSSYRAYAGYEKAEAWLRTTDLISRSGGNRNNPFAAYRKYVQHHLTQGVEPGKRERLCDIVAIGSATFAEQIRRAAGQGNPEITNRRELRKWAMEEDVRRAVEEVRGKRWNEFVAQRGDWGPGLYLWAVRRYCGLTLREAGSALGDMKPSAVSMAIKRWESRATEDTALQHKQQLIENYFTDSM